MKLKNFIRLKLIDLTGYWIFKRNFLPVGVDLVEDLKNKFSIKIQTIFDVGANIGQTAISFSHHFPSAKIFSFEPISSTFDKLLFNTQHLKNIISHKLAFSNKKESVQVKIFDESNSFLNSLNTLSMNESIDAKIEMVHSETIDSFLQQHSKIESIDLLKIDTEGYELAVLNGAVESMINEKIKLIYLEVGFFKTDLRHSYYPGVHQFLEEKNYIFFGLYEITHHNISNRDSFANALYVHSSYLNEIIFS